VVEAAKAAELRKKFPRALLVVKGPDAAAAPHVNAFLLEGIGADDPLLALVKNLRSRHDNAVLAAFAGDAKDAPARLKLAKDNGFLGYAAADFAAIAAP
jgi:hypothetical protein